MLLYEWKRTLKRPTLFLFVIIFPIVLLLVTGLAIYSLAKEEVDQIDILVLDEDETFETTTLIDQLESDETINEHVNFIRGDQPQSIDYYLNSDARYAAIVHVPAGFTADLRSGINREIDVYLNENIAISSSLAHMLLESGQNYISAAQSGVNTVNQLYIKSLDDPDERRSFVQQMTVHFTLLTLGRNNFFELDESLESNMLSWVQQVYLSGTTVLLFLTYLLFVMMFQQKNDAVIVKRWSLIQVTPLKRIFTMFFHHFSFSVIYLLALSIILHFLFNIPFNFFVLIQWFLLAAILHGIYIFCYSLFKNQSLSLSLFFIVSSFFLLLSGFLIPPIYLTNVPELMTLFHDGFKQLLLTGDAPIILWGVLFVAVVLIIFLSSLFYQRGKLQ